MSRSMRAGLIGGVSRRGKKDFVKPARTGRVRCPHPECDHVGDLITKVHCRMHHNMERHELFEKYGEPQSTSSVNPYALRMNSQMKTIYNNNAPTISGQKSGAFRS